MVIVYGNQFNMANFTIVSENQNTSNSSEVTLLGNSHVCTGFNVYHAKFSLSLLKLFFSRLN